jgi:hypothetical protein
LAGKPNRGGMGLYLACLAVAKAKRGLIKVELKLTHPAGLDCWRCRRAAQGEYFTLRLVSYDLAKKNHRRWLLIGN